MRNRCTLMPVTPTMSARSQRSQSIGSTFSSISVTVCSAGVSAARSGRHATGRLARLPRNGKAYSIPQYDTSNRGLMSTMSAIAKSTPNQGEIPGARKQVTGERRCSIQYTTLVDPVYAD